MTPDQLQTTFQAYQREYTFGAFGGKKNGSPCSAIPTSESVIDQAWQAQMRGDWEGMLALVASLNLSVYPEAALVLARAATRHGAYRLALRLLGWGIHRFRETGHDVHLARCHGALGEVLVRCNFAALALQHMQIAHSLMPRGHHSRQMQYSYIAMPLARLGQLDVAIEYYMRALFLAEIQQDKTALAHALIRRGALAFWGDDSAFREMQHLKARYQPDLTGVLKGYDALLELCAGWKEGVLTPEDITLCRNRAMGAFHRIAPIEYETAARVLPDNGAGSKDLAGEFESLCSGIRLPFYPDVFQLADLPVQKSLATGRIACADALALALKGFFI